MGKIFLIIMGLVVGTSAMAKNSKSSVSRKPSSAKLECYLSIGAVNGENANDSKTLNAGDTVKLTAGSVTAEVEFATNNKVVAVVRHDGSRSVDTNGIGGLYLLIDEKITLNCTPQH